MAHLWCKGVVATVLIMTAAALATERVLVTELGEAQSVPVVGPEETALFILRGSNTAKAALRGMKLNECNEAEVGEDTCEFVGVPSDHQLLKDVGFELIQMQQTSRFAGDGYHNPDELKSEFEKLATNYPGEAAVIDITELVNAPKTVNGKSIYALKISDNVQQDESEPNALLVSNHHARELVTPELALRSAQELLKAYTKGDEVAKRIVETQQTYIIPTMNPDSLEEVWQGNPWKRVNTNGVDLNRNYPVGWDLGCGGDPTPGSESYRGPHPFSEPETQTMEALQARMNFAKVMDVHSYAEEVRINYGCVSLPNQIHELFIHHARGVSSKIGYEAGQSCCMGGDIHYAYKTHGSLAFLVEAGGRSFQPDSVQRESTLQEMWPGVKQFLAIPISVSGKVTVEKSDGSVPASGAEITIPDLDFKLGEVSTVSSNGRYHLWLPEGKWQVTIRWKDGETDIENQVEVSAAADGNVQDITLTQ